MEIIKKIGIFLVVLLALFMLIGMGYGVMFFFFVLKLMLWSIVIAGIVIIWFNYRK